MFTDSKLRPSAVALLCIALLVSNIIGLAFVFNGANAFFIGGPLSFGQAVGFGGLLTGVVAVVLLKADPSESVGRDELILAAGIVGGCLLFWNGLAWLPVIGTPSLAADLAFAVVLVAIEVAIWLTPALRARFVVPVEMFRRTVHTTSSFTPHGVTTQTHSVTRRVRRGSSGAR